MKRMLVLSRPCFSQAGVVMDSGTRLLTYAPRDGASRLLCHIVYRVWDSLHPGEGGRFIPDGTLIYHKKVLKEGRER